MQFIPADRVITAIEEVLVSLSEFLADAQTSEPENTNLINCIKGFQNRLELRIATIKYLSAADAEPEQQRQFLTTTGQLIDKLPEMHGMSSPLLSAFSVAIQGRLECAMPPRPKVQLSFDDAIKIFKQIVDGSTDILRIHDYNHLGDILSYFEDFAMRRPPELPYVRCQLMKQFLVNGKILGKLNMRNVLIEDIKDLCSPVLSIFNVPINHPVRFPVEEFFGQAEVCYETMFSVMCHNRSRLRQSLCSLILEWDSLQVSAENLESSPEMAEFSPILHPPGSNQELPALPLSSWVYYRKLKLMIWIVFLGFELDIYKLEEWSLMLWYASYLSDRMAAHLSRVESIVDTMVNIQNREHQAYAKAKKNRQAKSIKAPQEYVKLEAVKRTKTYISNLKAENDVYRELCQGYLCLVAVLSLSGIIQPVQQIREMAGEQLFTSSELLYKLRLKPFSTIGVPELPSYQQYLQLSDLQDWTVSSFFSQAKL